MKAWSHITLEFREEKEYMASLTLYINGKVSNLGTSIPHYYDKVLSLYIFDGIVDGGYRW